MLTLINVSQLRVECSVISENFCGRIIHLENGWSLKCDPHLFSAVAEIQLNMHLHMHSIQVNLHMLYIYSYVHLHVFAFSYAFYTSELAFAIFVLKTI
jgi:hypothetical protein